MEQTFDEQNNKIKIAFYVARYEGKPIPTPPSIQYLAGYLVGNNIVNEKNIIFSNSVSEIILLQIFRQKVAGIKTIIHMLY